jgi:putative phosphoribosyl transferase
MASGNSRERAVVVPAAGVALDGDLAVPEGAMGVVLFAHGSGSSRRSPRNRQVAKGLQGAGYATLLMDLLTADEDAVDLRTRELRFDIGLLAGRLIGAVDWLGSEPDTTSLPLAIFGASTGAAAALTTAADRTGQVRLVISRGGRPDLAGEALARVQAPVLLIVGGDDRQVIRLNQQAASALPGPVQLEIVPGATHLFEEPGALDAVIDLATQALSRHLGAGRGSG